VTLHQHSPRQTLGLRSLDTLELYSTPKPPGPIKIPDILRVQLNLFSGQLYLKSYAEYQLVCAYLGVASIKTADNQVVAPDGFITDGNGKSSAFTKSPLKFLKLLMFQIRKDCQDSSGMMSTQYEADSLHVLTIKECTMSFDLIRWACRKSIAVVVLRTECHVTM
jgi:hypothetical protein